MKYRTDQKTGKTENLISTEQTDGSKPSFKLVTDYLKSIFNENVIDDEPEKELINIHSFFEIERDVFVDLETKTGIVLNVLSNHFNISVPIEQQGIVITAEDDIWDTISLKGLVS